MTMTMFIPIILKSIVVQSSVATIRGAAYAFNQVNMVQFNLVIYIHYVAIIAPAIKLGTDKYNVNAHKGT